MREYLSNRLKVSREEQSTIDLVGKLMHKLKGISPQKPAAEEPKKGLTSIREEEEKERAKPASLEKAQPGAKDYGVIDLNKLTDEELDAHKKKMDEMFYKNYRDPKAQGFVYDIEVLSLATSNPRRRTSEISRRLTTAGTRRYSSFVAGSELSHRQLQIWQTYAARTSTT